MDSTERSTPNSEDDSSSSPFLLTPNAKIKALLAKLEKPEPVTENSSARDHLLATMSKSLSSRIKKANPFLDTSDEEDTNDFVYPKGRIAAAMKTNDNHKDNFSFESKLQETKNISTVLESPTFDVIAHNNGDGDVDVDNESDPITPRKRRNRFTRLKTPNSIMMRNSTSPSLFVSPHRSLLPRSNSQSSDSDPFPEDLPKNLSKNSKFMALVQKKKKEQLALQTKVNKMKSNKKEEKPDLKSDLQDSENITDAVDSDEELGRRLTLQPQRRRKASKKALEDINRETQRIMRQQQLSHKPMIKKKITIESLFSKFNFRPQKNPDPIQPTSSSSAATKTDSDVQNTPPTSPLKSHNNDDFKNFSATASSFTNKILRERESSEEILDIRPRSLSPIVTQSNESSHLKAEDRNCSKTQGRVQSKFNFEMPRSTSIGNKHENKNSDSESDSDLEIVGRKFAVQGRLNDVFDRVPIKKSREANSFHTLKMLAQLRSPPPKQKVNNSQSISTVELQISLQQRARKQAAVEREERLEQLKAKGVIVQTNEERQIDQANFDDLLAKARAEAEQLRKQELAAKKKQTDNPSKTELMDDSTENEDWKEDEDKRHDDLSESDSNDGDESGLSDVESNHIVQGKENTPYDENNSEAAIVEVSTVMDSGDAQNEVDETLLEHQNILVTNNIVDPDEDESIPLARRSNVRNRFIISDDEDDIPKAHNMTPLPPGTSGSTDQIQPQTPSHEATTSVLRSATKTFIPGLPVSGPAGLGLTQIFAGTMDDSQVSSAACSSESNSGHNRTDILRQAALLPSSLLSPKEVSQLEQAAELSQISRISESQNLDGSQPLSFPLEDKCFHNIIQDAQLNQPLEPTQDLGFGELTPIKGRFDEKLPSRTRDIDCRNEMEFKAGKGKKRLYRKAPDITSFSDEETFEQEKSWQPTEDPFRDDIDSNLEENIFDVLIKASKKKKDNRTLFNKKESKARDLFNEQAEESDDEYAGLGGLSDDSGIDEEDQFAKDMIDDEGGEDIDETVHAAFFAERERVNNEKQIEKLYNDISRGMLRRKRGAEYELSDSDDGGEARRRRKRQEFAKMRKALLADERVSKIANNPKSQAFLQAIEDRGSSEEDNFLFESNEKEEDQDSQNQSQPEVISESQPGSVDNPAKIAKKPDINLRLRHLRPANTCKKPSSLSEIRFSLSNILDEPNSIEPVNSTSESEQDNDAINYDSILDENLNSADEQTAESLSSNTTRKKRPVVIDRISLKKNLSVSSSSNDSHLLFVPSSSANNFKVPSLLRRATNSSVNSSTYSNTDSSVTKATERNAGSENSGVKRGGTWGSGLNSFSRDSERRAKIIKKESRREKKLIQSAISRRSLVSGLLGTGIFE
ncbi:putative mrc1-like domain-containing protein [Erysiphe neolycopersici]|uniref:Putative mrc1-like domain-containing protein n=1 Tax=Erysiphe neolycopersici TaxID=212602 RepID=A0A420I2S4_9PEZI|nr:putative mrc1-like domain-containing protein [Erysiphe neolycopersici]